MTQLIRRERWPKPRTPSSEQFFVSAMADDPLQPEPPEPRYPPTRAPSSSSRRVSTLRCSKPLDVAA